MDRGRLPSSQLIGTMIAFPTPCGHSINYPAFLGHAALKDGACHAFHSTCDCGRTYIIATEPDGAHIRGEGPATEIVDLYESLPWAEWESLDVNGIFFCKLAPSHAALVALLGPKG